MVVCRGGECGNRSKHPGFDHAEQLRVLSQGIDAGTTSVAIGKCLDACEHSNVVVVVPGADQRDAGVTPVWLGGVLTPEATDDVVGWISAGGPGSEPPPLVDILTFAPTRMSRRELEEPGTLSGRGGRGDDRAAAR